MPMLIGVDRSRYVLTDFAWHVIGPLLPNTPGGVPRVATHYDPLAAKLGSPRCRCGYEIWGPAWLGTPTDRLIRISQNASDWRGH